ncbi:MAG: hypothetical protein GY803_05355 [Chloroflexi bacterium]|nr:hypothetical protein [Chloroflexota bacterium]
MLERLDIIRAIANKKDPLDPIWRGKYWGQYVNSKSDSIRLTFSLEERAFNSKHQLPQITKAINNRVRRIALEKQAGALEVAYLQYEFSGHWLARASGEITLRFDPAPNLGRETRTKSHAATNWTLQLVGRGINDYEIRAALRLRYEFNDDEAQAFIDLARRGRGKKE